MVWEDNDASYLAPNLKGTALFLASGNGLPGPLDPTLQPGAGNQGQTLSNTGGVVADGLTEGEIWDMNKAFVHVLDRAGIPHTDYFYGDGTHFVALLAARPRAFPGVARTAHRAPTARPARLLLPLGEGRLLGVGLELRRHPRGPRVRVPERRGAGRPERASAAARWR